MPIIQFHVLLNKKHFVFVENENCGNSETPIQTSMTDKTSKKSLNMTVIVVGPAPGSVSIPLAHQIVMIGFRVFVALVDISRFGIRRLHDAACTYKEFRLPPILHISKLDAYNKRIKEV